MRLHPLGIAIAVILASCEAQDTRPKALLDLQDGPHLFHQKDGSITARWITAGKVEQKVFAAGAPIELPQFAPLLGKSLSIGKHEVDPPILPQPERLLAISDVEGEYDHMRRFLLANGVIDAKGRWAFGKGHLVCVGDMIDRGQQVTETLWMLYRLSREARSAGGRVHYVLGNHEAMFMGGDTTYAAPKYQAVAKLLGIPCEGLLGADTELGRWLRTRNALVRVGDLLFVHAGISAAVANQKVDLPKLNGEIRSVLGTPPLKIKNRRHLALTWGSLGPLWYRGYFEEFTVTFGPSPTLPQMDKILRNLEAKKVVVGHTKVKRVTPKLGGRVLAIDTPWTDVANVQGILVQKDQIQVIDVSGRRSALK